MKKHANIHNFEELLDAEYGQKGSNNREAFDEAAKVYYWRNLLKTHLENHIHSEFYYF